MNQLRLFIHRALNNVTDFFLIFFCFSAFLFLPLMKCSDIFLFLFFSDLFFLSLLPFSNLLCVLRRVRPYKFFTYLFFRYLLFIKTNQERFYNYYHTFLTFPNIFSLSLFSSYDQVSQDLGLTCPTILHIFQYFSKILMAHNNFLTQLNLLTNQFFFLLAHTSYTFLSSTAK